jgi:hypothetical protein
MENTLVSRIIDFYGSSLQPITSSSLDRFTLPVDIKEFLKSFGLPPESNLLLHFYTGTEDLTIYSEGQDRFLVIGDDYGTRLGMKEHTGEIEAIDINGTLPTRFVNSSILTLLAFLEIYSKKQPELAQASDEEASKIAERMRDEMHSLDAKALDDPESWWSVILEQTEQGLM